MSVFPGVRTTDGFTPGTGLPGILVTGAAGYLGGGLIERLAASRGPDRVYGVDVRVPRAPVPGVRYDLLDVRRLGAGFLRDREVECVVHLAFVVDPHRDERLMYGVNVDGTRAVLDAAGQAGVRRVVAASSATAYGAHPDNAVPLDESQPIRGNEEFPYARHKRLAEGVLAGFAAANPECSVAVVRPAIVVGPRFGNYIARYLGRRVVFTIHGFDPPMQFVHEDDVAGALEALVGSDARGGFNLAPPGTLRLSEVVRRGGGRRVSVSEGAMRVLMSAAWTLRITSLTEAPPGVLPYLAHPWVVDGSRIERDVGYRYRYDSVEALDAWLAARA